MIYGGIDKSNLSIRTFIIVNVKTKSKEIIEPSQNSIYPKSRYYHKVMRFGKILIMYGGKSVQGEILSDFWKFIIPTKSWVNVKNEITGSDNFNLPKSNYIFTKIDEDERPVIFGGLNKNGEFSSNLVRLNIPVCISEVTLENDFLCIPCEEGYVLDENKKCKKCKKGSYQFIEKEYTKSVCMDCPSKTFNDNEGSLGISSCKLCPFGTYNSDIGKDKCSLCNENDLCLTGSLKPFEKSNYEISKANKFYLQEENNPDFISSNRKVREDWITSALILSSIILIILSLFFFILSKIFRKSISRMFIHVDLMPITGGAYKNLNGGVFTILYIYLNIILIAVFILRFLYYNDLIEVIPLSSTHGEIIRSSFNLEVRLIGYDSTCVDPNQKLDLEYYLCSKDLEIQKRSKNIPDKFDDFTDSKTAKCMLKNGICSVNISCINCKSINSGDIISVKMAKKGTYIQMYHWTFSSIWGEINSEEDGYSKLDALFKPDEDLTKNYVFGGSSPSSVDLLLTPIIYSKTSENKHLSGYRSTFKNYERGSVKSMFNYFTDMTGAQINFNVRNILSRLHLVQISMK